MSLLKEIKEDAKNKFPGIYKDNNKPVYGFIAKVFSANFRHIILFYSSLIVLVFLYSCYVDFSFLKIINVNFEDNIKTFTTCAITLVSMNLFVTNLLFTHLKDERDEIQSIIDEKINFKFITYLGFSIIICTLLLYFFSSTIGVLKINSNILIFIFCSFIFYIFQLVNLYNTVFNFIHKEKRLGIIKSELNIEFSKAFYSEFLKKEFIKRYQALIVSKHNFSLYNSWGVENQNLITVKTKKDKKSFLTDINIKKLDIKLNEVSCVNKYYYKLELDKEYLENSEISIFAFPDKLKTDFFKCYTFSEKKNLVEDYKQEHLDKLLKKIENNTLNNKFSDLKSNLNDLEDIYMKYIDKEI